MTLQKTTAPTPDEEAGMIWWNSLDRIERGYWLALANTAIPAEAWECFKRAELVEVKS